ncbi:hypothetical protein [Macrococcus lamae]|uniref:Uncharacterized protein n=1 Tax=Macrococcus lamae TaxID=198484 RepID=A0A4R6BTD4_9STAP|nr:hypothetical protein [Macrococcus lamae]TDM07894.1 hypothetical protein ERX29_07530 [Macrococcus lamae]
MEEEQEMKQLIYAVLCAAGLLAMTVLWDLLFGTKLTLLLLNVDFIIDYSRRRPSFLEETAYHIIIGIVIFYSLSIIYRKYHQLYKPTLIICLLLTCSLYYLLTLIAVRPFFFHTIIGVTGWLVTHIIYFIAINTLIKRNYTISQ